MKLLMVFLLLVPCAFAIGTEAVEGEELVSKHVRRELGSKLKGSRNQLKVKRPRILKNQEAEPSQSPTDTPTVAPVLNGSSKATNDKRVLVKGPNESEGHRTLRFHPTLIPTFYPTEETSQETASWPTQFPTDETSQEVTKRLITKEPDMRYRYSMPTSSPSPTQETSYEPYGRKGTKAPKKTKEPRTSRRNWSPSPTFMPTCNEEDDCSGRRLITD